MLTLVPLSILSTSFAPALISESDKLAVLAMGLGVGILGGGLLEEPGWTGFVTPEMRRRLNPLATGVTLGMIWGAWHLLPTYWGSGNADGTFDPWLFAPPCVFYLGVLPAYRTLIVSQHEATGSLLVAVLQHASLTACSLFILAPAATGAPLAGYYVILSALMWAAVQLMRRTWLAPVADGVSRS
jgi:membrane protease YdiL (CAAX protease family)